MVNGKMIDIMVYARPSLRVAETSVWGDCYRRDMSDLTDQLQTARQFPEKGC